jgi:hypothetical protein
MNLFLYFKTLCLSLEIVVQKEREFTMVAMGNLKKIDCPIDSNSKRLERDKTFESDWEKVWNLKSMKLI